MSFFLALRRVRTAVGLFREAAGSACVECVLGEEAVALGEAEFGVLRLSPGEPFPVERTVLWLGVQNLAFSLVCDMHENLLLAEGTLRNLARHCMEELRLLGPGSEVRQHSHHHSCFSIIIIVVTLPVITVFRTCLINNYLIFGSRSQNPPIALLSIT